ncbi:MAG: DUF885 domain-containing protein, partial [Acidobacteria bacterium]|nr:DUF885 domain-containing protein [Acidobacteriota bacterium]
MKFLILLLLIAWPAIAQNSESAKLKSLFDAEWQWSLANNPEFASFLGDKRYNDRWTDVSLEAIRSSNRRTVETLAKLKQIDRAKLSTAERVNYDLFQDRYETDVKEFETRLYLLPINQRRGIQTADEIVELMRFETVKDYEDWIARLNAFPRLAAQTLELMRAGKAEKMIWSRQVLSRIPAQLDKQITPDPEQSPFYAPFRSMHMDIPPAEQTRLQTAAKQAITQKVIPEFKKIKDFFVGEYLPSAPP